MHRRTRRQAGGFTLLELILAAGVAAMMSLALYAAMASALKARRQADALVGPPRQATIALDLIEADLQSVMRATGSRAGLFVGYAAGVPGSESSALRFTCLGQDRAIEPTGDDPMLEGVREVELEVVANGVNRQIVRRITRNLLTQGEREYEDEPLVGAVRAFGLRYYDGSGWSDQWDAAAQSTGETDPALPLAVEITIELEPATSNRAGAAASGYRVTRVIPIPVAISAEDATAAGGG